MVARLCQRFFRLSVRDLSGALDDYRAQPARVVDGNIKRFHQGACIPTEPLLAWHERVAVMLVLDLSLGEIIGEPDVVVRCQQQARARPSHPLTDRADLIGCGFLLGHDVIEPITMSVSVSDRIRSSIGSAYPA